MVFQLAYFMTVRCQEQLSLLRYSLFTLFALRSTARLAAPMKPLKCAASDWDVQKRFASVPKLPTPSLKPWWIRRRQMKQGARRSGKR